MSWQGAQEVRCQSTMHTPAVLCQDMDLSEHAFEAPLSLSQHIQTNLAGKCWYYPFNKKQMLRCAELEYCYKKHHMQRAPHKPQLACTGSQLAECLQSPKHRPEVHTLKTKQAC